MTASPPPAVRGEQAAQAAMSNHERPSCWYLTKRGPAELRRLLYIAAMSAARSALWRPIYERYRARGLAAKTIYVILARKLARIAFSMVRYNNDFNPETLKNACAKP